MQNWIEKLGLGERAASMVVWIGLSVFLLVVVLALAVWLIKTLRPTLNIGGSHGRSGRPQRLAITDAFTLDREGRKLVIIRRDNVEHLLLIGGPNDVLIEPCILRGERSQRDRGARGGAEAEMLHVAETPQATEIPHAEAPAMPAMAPSAPMISPVVAPITLPSFRSAAPPPPKSPAPARLDDEFERALAAMQAAQRQQATQRQQPPLPATPTAPVSRPEPPSASHPHPTAPAANLPAPEHPVRQEPVSEMARRLNEVLQKPLSGTLRPPFNRPIPPVPATLNSAPKPAPAASDAPSPVAPPPPLAAAPPPSPPVPAPAADSTAPAPAPAPAPEESEMDLLEEEMARLLGRTPEPKKPGAT